MLTVFLLAGCGGGGGDGDAPAREGSLESRIIRSSATRTDYPLNIYLPPASAGPLSGLPVLYVLDGESWFDTLVGMAESTRQRVIIVGIGTAGQRARDFVPGNSCTPNGGGNAAYFNFIRQELIPYVEGNFGGDPDQRALFGHSHGGSFVLYAMFSQTPGQHSFKAYLASESSISCMSTTAFAWERDYAAAQSALPVRLHLSYASQGNYTSNLDYAAAITQRNYAHLVFVGRSYSGTHNGIVPQVLTDALGFAFVGGP
ncbi:alpha/beta hydrolase [Hydrogenophaga sp.]|uniref:alpha/beta hydrolase n=1 Tax=Hydrogenophaga sp. TaxID=1904254 RepID=UPI003F704682